MKTSFNSQEELTRRRFMAGALGVTAGAAISGSLAYAAQRPAGGSARRVDFHHHMLPPKHIDAIAAQRESGRPRPWNPAMSIEEMDKNEIATAIVSLIQPGVTIGTIDQARALARE